MFCLDLSRGRRGPTQPGPRGNRWKALPGRFPFREDEVEVMPTKLPLEKFYGELVRTQQVLNQKHLGWHAFRDAIRLSAERLARGQTNFVKMLWKFNKVYNQERQLADHRREVHYEMRLPESHHEKVEQASLFIHPQTLLKPVGAQAGN